MMRGWVDYLHLEFVGEHILFHSLRLQSAWSFILCAILISVICLCERFLTLVLDKNIQPKAVLRSRLATAAWKSSLYGVVTLLRLLYLLVAMSNQLGAIAIVVLALSIGQFVIEYMDYQEPSSGDRQAEEPLLGTSFMERRPTGRFRTRSKPDSIFIHPNESNLARADVVALELGITGDTELVRGNRAQGQAWLLGRGRDVAREIFGGSRQQLASDTGFKLEDDDDDARV